MEHNVERNPALWVKIITSLPWNTWDKVPYLVLCDQKTYHDNQLRIDLSAYPERHSIASSKGREFCHDLGLPSQLYPHFGDLYCGKDQPSIYICDDQIGAYLWESHRYVGSLALTSEPLFLRSYHFLGPQHEIMTKGLVVYEPLEQEVRIFVQNHIYVYKKEQLVEFFIDEIPGYLSLYRYAAFRRILGKDLARLLVETF